MHLWIDSKFVADGLLFLLLFGVTGSWAHIDLWHRVEHLLQQIGSLNLSWSRIGYLAIWTRSSSGYMNESMRPWGALTLPGLEPSCSFVLMPKDTMSCVLTVCGNCELSTLRSRPRHRMLNLKTLKGSTLHFLVLSMNRRCLQVICTFLALRDFCRHWTPGFRIYPWPLCLPWSTIWLIIVLMILEFISVVFWRVDYLADQGLFIIIPLQSSCFRGDGTPYPLFPFWKANFRLFAEVCEEGGCLVFEFGWWFWAGVVSWPEQSWS